MCNNFHQRGHFQNQRHHLESIHLSSRNLPDVPSVSLSWRLGSSETTQRIRIPYSAPGLGNAPCTSHPSPGQTATPYRTLDKLNREKSYESVSLISRHVSNTENFLMKNSRFRASQCFLIATGVKCKKFGIWKTLNHVFYSNITFECICNKRRAEYVQLALVHNKCFHNL